MKNIKGRLSLDHSEIVFYIDAEPEMEDEINVRLFGRGFVIALNPNYKETNETWFLIKWDDASELQLQYVVKK